VVGNVLDHACYTDHDDTKHHKPYVISFLGYNSLSNSIDCREYDTTANRHREIELKFASHGLGRLVPVKEIPYQHGKCVNQL
jgi:hypothetical protein